MPGVQGATYCVPIWGTYYNLLFGKQAIPDFAQPAVMPHWKPWHGGHSVTAPAATASPVPSSSPSPGLSSSPSAAPSATGAASPAPTPKPSSSATTGAP